MYVEKIEQHQDKEAFGFSIIFVDADPKKRKRECNYGDFEQNKNQKPFPELPLDVKYVGLDPDEKLIVAAQAGKFNECEKLLAEINNPDYIDNTENAGEWRGATALYWAVKGWLTAAGDNRVEFERIISLLIERGANLATLCTVGKKQESVEQLIDRAAASKKSGLQQLITRLQDSLTPSLSKI